MKIAADVCVVASAVHLQCLVELAAEQAACSMPVIDMPSLFAGQGTSAEG